MFRIKDAVFTVLLFSVFSAWAHASEVTHTGRIDSVTLYPSGALVKREMTVDLDAGPSRITFSDLPGSLDPQSVRLSVQGASPATILHIDLKRRHTPEATDPRLQAAETKLKELKDQSNDIKAALRDLEDQRKMLDTLRLSPVGNQATLPDPAQIKNLLELTYEEREKLRYEIRGSERDLEALAEKIRAAEKEVSVLKGSRKRLTYEAVAHLDAEKADTRTLFLEYTVSGASWKPEYIIRADEGSENLFLEFSARATQTSGEDWLGVKLLVSTAKPRRSLYLPPIRPWYLTYHEPPGVSPLKEARTGKMKAMGKLEAAGLSEPSKPREAELLGTTVHSFRVPGTVSLAGDGTEKLITLKTDSLPAEYGWRAAPLLTPEVLLFAELKNTTGLALEPGKCRIFYDGVYTGSTRLATVPSGESFELTLGVDRNVTVKRDLVQKKENRSGLISKEQVRQYRFRITASNHRSKPITLSLRDRIPVSQHADIKVTWSADPAPSKEKNGILTWDLIIGPETARTIDLSYKISYPADKEVMLP